MEQSSYRKLYKSRMPFIKGCKPVVKNAQFIISSGVPSLDYMIGGGIPTGSIVLIEEDKYATFAKLLLKYFMAEGIVCEHSIFVASQDYDPDKLVNDLPSVVKDDKKHSSTSDDKMTIAWRYQNLQVVDSSPTMENFGHNFDLTKPMNPESLSNCSISSWNGDKSCQSVPTHLENELFKCYQYRSLLDALRNRIQEGKFQIDIDCEKRNLLRIVIHSLGSPMWDDQIDPHCSKNRLSDDIQKFLCCLRALMRNSYAVCIVTVPTHLFQDRYVIKRLQHICDTCLRLESFAGSDKETNPLYQDYHGLFHIDKLPSINTVACHTPESFDLAFKLKRKRFTIEKLHLPPELQDTSQREQDDPVPHLKRTTMACGGFERSHLEF